jgi:hypothetical protein
LPIGGGGSGTVTGVSGTAPIVSSGGAAPAISITPATSGNAGSMSAADKAKLDGAATIVSAVTGTLPITVASGTSTPLIAINAATTTTAGSAQLADATASKAGTSATLVSTPAFSVPKDAANMTGAAILPAGTDLQRAAIASPVAGMTRFNTTNTSLEFYDGAKWVPLAPNVPACSVYAGTTQSVVSVVYTKVALDTEIFDNFNFFNTATNRFQPLVPGYYQVSCVCRAVAGGSNLSNINTVLYKNGSAYQRFAEIANGTFSVQVAQLVGSCIVYLNGSTDYIELYGFLAGTSPSYESAPAFGAFSSLSAVLVAS